MEYEELTINQLKAAVLKLDEAIKKYREYAAKGNVEAKQKVKKFMHYKEYVLNLIKEKEEEENHDPAEEYA